MKSRFGLLLLGLLVSCGQITLTPEHPPSPSLLNQVHDTSALSAAQTALIGRWNRTDWSSLYVIFNADGTGVDFLYGFNIGPRPFTYQLVGNTLHIISGGSVGSTWPAFWTGANWTVVVNGNSMSLSGRSSMNLVRVTPPLLQQSPPPPPPAAPPVSGQTVTIFGSSTPAVIDGGG